MNERDERLGELLAVVRRYPRQSAQWRKAMNQLLLEIQHLPGLAKSAHPDYPEVLDDTLLQLSEQIQNFDPKPPSLAQSLVHWINLKLRLKYRVRELHAPNRRSANSTAKTAREDFKRQGQKPPLSLDAPLGEGSGETFSDRLPSPHPSTLWELEAQIQRDQAQRQERRIGIQLRQYIEQDPQGKLRHCHPASHPDCHCQILSQRLLLKSPPDKLSQIARDFNINYHTLNWHWKNKGLPLLQAIARNLGYQPIETRE